jgi:entericidin B
LLCTEERATFAHTNVQETLQMKKLVAALFVVSLVPTLVACNTIRGVGKDVQAGGEAVEEAAKEVQEEIAK